MGGGDVVMVHYGDFGVKGLGYCRCDGIGGGCGGEGSGGDDSKKKNLHQECENMGVTAVHICRLEFSRLKKSPLQI